MIDRLETSGNAAFSSRWLRYGLPLSVILLFAAGVLDFATLRWKHLPPHKRLNNGSVPTFFAFHIGPSYNFSEDFHLYYLRAKRIERRGWTDSLLYSRPYEQPNYAAPVQVMLSRLALLTEGSPRRYALYMFATLAIGWSTLYVAARSWLPREIATSSLLLAVMITVLFEAVHLIFLPPNFDSYGQWPTFRALRMSTMAWTSPLLVSVMVALASLICDRERIGMRLAGLALMLGLLLGTDNWAFAAAWMASGIVLAWIGVSAVFAWRRDGAWPQASWRVMIGLCAPLAITFLLHDQINGSLVGDALLRGGFGPEWMRSRESDPNVVRMAQWLGGHALVPLACVLLLSLVELRASRQGSERPLQMANDTWKQLRWLALLPVATAVVLNLALRRGGMECFLRSQIYWRVDYCLLFAFVLTSAEWLRTSLPVFAKRFARVWPLIVALGLTALFGYHCYRTHWFVKHTARRDFFLTADAERLRPWLEEFDRRHQRYELATASVELNYLCAFWTNADMLLPSGFPYHNAASNEEILDRAVQLLRLYGTSKKAWLKFTYPTPEAFTELWHKSRVAASGRGYLYHLFHRWTYFTPPKKGEWFETGRMEIGAALGQSNQEVKLPTPEVILVEDVSRELGDPDLSNYRLAYRGGSIEAWVRKDVPEIEALPASSDSNRDE